MFKLYSAYFMFSFWIRKRIFSLIRFFIKPIVKFETEFDDGVSVESINNNQSVYAIPGSSISDLVALDLANKILDLPKPLSYLKDSKVNRLINLRSPKYNRLQRKILRLSPRNLSSVLKLNTENLQIVPVSFYWGKHPDKQKSLFKILFSQSWAATGPLKKFFRVLLHGRSLIIQFHKPVTMLELKEKEKELNAISKLVTRYLRNLFRRSKQAVLGPEISHRRTLVKSLSQNEEVRKKITEMSKGNKKLEKKLDKKALKYANEICSDLNYPIIRLLIAGFSWFWNTRYDGVHVNNLEEIKQLSKDNSLVYVPCHRSHIDYCALSYLLYKEGLMVPQIPAGNNLNQPILGKVLKSGGAIFMRRSFNNPLYSTVFFQHIRNLMRRGSSIEFFPEGGRSRSGLTLSARPGLISMILRSFSGLNSRDVKVVPIYIGYEKILEGKSYLSELSGKSKKGESLLDPFKVLKDFNNYLGNAYVNFGKPIDLKDFLSDRLVDEESLPNSLADKPAWLREATTTLGEEIMQGVNSSVAVTSSSLFAMSLLSDPTQSLEEEKLKQRIDLFIELINSSETYNNIWLTNTDKNEIIKKSLQLGFVKQALVGNSTVYKLSDDETAILSFYKNNIAHLFMLHSAVCETLRYVDKISINEMERLVSLVFPFFKRDFHLSEKSKDLEQLIENVLETLVNLGLIEKNESGDLVKPVKDTLKYQEFLSISNICEPSIKRFYIVMHTLWNNKPLDRVDLQERCLNIAKKLEEIEGWPYPEFSEKAKFNQFIDKMLAEKFIIKVPENKLQASRITKKVQKDYTNHFNTQFINLIEELN